ncbi:hypothetical protein LJB77_02410, partial [Ruminococcaceae bacterium OttesenSCG-928-N02]|nr:hypothetical protein [Ruminococcaceae bacterium OttesenSCG-928-N02]
MAYKIRERRPATGTVKKKRDRVMEYNPVFVIGLGLTSVIMAGTTLQTAAMVGLAVALLLTPTRVIAAVLSRIFPYRLRGIVYTGVAAVLYIGVYYVLSTLFGADLVKVGIYLPLLVMDPLLISRFENPFKEKPVRAMQKGLAMTAGFEIALFTVAGLRELLATGRLFGVSLFSTAPAP